MLVVARYRLIALDAKSSPLRVAAPGANRAARHSYHNSPALTLDVNARSTKPAASKNRVAAIFPTSPVKTPLQPPREASLQSQRVLD